jgi:serine/threonine-protein kinase HipA
MKNILAAEVRLWGALVGTLYYDQEQAYTSFRYDQKFLRQGIALSPILMPIKNIDARTTYVFVPRDPLDFNTFRGLPPFIADTLPDRFGNTVIDAWLSKQGRTPQSFTSIERLCYIGKRGMGALEFRPAIRTGLEKIVDVDIAALITFSEAILSERKKLKTNIIKKDAIQDILRVGTSAGGARPKAVIAYNEQTKDILSGQIAAIPDGFEHYLLKLDGVTDKETGAPTSFGRIEYAYYKMATDCGINMTECRLLEENNRAHFMTRRFDRPGGGEKLHVQTLCALADMNYSYNTKWSYEQLFSIIRTLGLPHPAIEAQYRRMVFNVVAKNCDDHTKNVSFIMNRDGQWSLSPAYDISYAYDPQGAWYYQHQMSINGKFTNFHVDDLEKLGKMQGVKRYKQIIAQICAIVSKWPVYATAAGIEKKIYAPIGKQHVLFTQNECYPV